MALNPIQSATPVPQGRGLNAWLSGYIGNFANALQALALEHTIATVPYGATVTVDLGQGGIQKLIITDGNDFTIAAPVNPTQLSRWLFIIQNNTGADLSQVITWNAAIHYEPLPTVRPATRISAFFYLDKDNTGGLAHYQATFWTTRVNN